MRRSLKAPGSLSSAFTHMYFGLSVDFGTKPHFVPVGNPAPPRPRSPERFTVSMISSGVFLRAIASASYPPCFLYTSSVCESGSPMVFVITGSKVAVSMSAIHLAQNDVDAPDAGDHVGDHASEAHALERLEIDERGRPHPGPVRNRPAVAHDVEAQLALRRFDRKIRVAGRRA